MLIGSLHFGTCTLYDVLIIVIYTALGSNAATHKAHLLSHVVTCVRRWGPLWAYSTFHFEGMNHQVKKLFHGSQDMNKQVFKLHVHVHVHCLPVGYHGKFIIMLVLYM